MREIKFRAWQRESKYMIKAALVHFDGRVFDLLCEPDHEDLTDKVDLIQFTGLKDKNGKEIYEGDVLENMKGHRFVMEYDGLAFGWRGLTPYANGCVEFSYDTITNPKMTEILELEIIGNIYENPELLKG